MDCIDVEASTGTCAGLTHLRLTNKVDEEPFEFLEFLDSRVDESCWLRMEEADDIFFKTQHVSSQLIAHQFPSETRFTMEHKAAVVSYPLWQALRVGFDNYIKWKLMKDSQTVNSPFKSMLMAHVALTRTGPGPSLPWDCLFENRVFSDEAVHYFFGNDSYFSLSHSILWDLAQSTKLSALNQYLINVFLDWCHGSRAKGMSRYFVSSPGWVGHVIEEFLNRSTTNILFEALVQTRNVGKGRTQIVKITFQVEGASRIVIHCVNNEEPDHYIEAPTWLLDAGVHGERDLNSDQDIRVSFRQFIEVCMPEVRGRLFSLLERNAGHAKPAIHDTVELGHLTDALEKKKELSKLTPYPLSEGQDKKDKDTKASRNPFAAWGSLETGSIKLVFAFVLGGYQLSALSQVMLIASTDNVYYDDG